MSSSNCCFLTCIQVSQEAGQVVRYSDLFQNFPQFVVIHTVKGFSVFNKAEVDVFLKFSWFINDPKDVGNLTSGSSAFSKSSLNIWKFSVQILLKPGLESSEHYFASMWGEFNCVVDWVFFGVAFLWDWNENWLCPVLWTLPRGEKSFLTLRQTKVKDRLLSSLPLKIQVSDDPFQHLTGAWPFQIVRRL